jgi:hypothetical protein
MDIVERCKEYLSLGGLFNPELMEHEKVRDLVIDCRDEIERLREALHEWDALIEYTYNGSREAMSAMTDAAHNTAQILYGDPPWPDPKSRAALKEGD